MRRHIGCLISWGIVIPVQGLCWEKLLSSFLTQIFPDLQMRVSEPRPSLELSCWPKCPLGYKGTVHTVRCIYTSHSLLLLWTASLPTQGFFPFFAKQPCERDKIILKSIIWWEFWQWVEDGNYSSIRLSGFGQISCIETGDQGMGSWIVFHCCHGDSDAGGL